MQNKRALIGLGAIALLLMGLPVIYFAGQNEQNLDSEASYIPGDVNGDTKITLDDGSAIRMYIEEGTYNKNADLDGDGTIDEDDTKLFYENLSLK
jgi:hypothetical protein